jgi:hypothetical protein
VFYSAKNACLFSDLPKSWTKVIKVFFTRQNQLKNPTKGLDHFNLDLDLKLDHSEQNKLIKAELP